MNANDPALAVLPDNVRELDAPAGKVYVVEMPTDDVPSPRDVLAMRSQLAILLGVPEPRVVFLRHGWKIHEVPASLAATPPRSLSAEKIAALKTAFEETYRGAAPPTAALGNARRTHDVETSLDELLGSVRLREAMTRLPRPNPTCDWDALLARLQRDLADFGQAYLFYPPERPGTVYRLLPLNVRYFSANGHGPRIFRINAFWQNEGLEGFSLVAEDHLESFGPVGRMVIQRPAAPPAPSVRRAQVVDGPPPPGAMEGGSVVFAPAPAAGAASVPVAICPQGHHRKDGGCMDDYCRCPCATCRAQCRAAAARAR